MEAGGKWGSETPKRPGVEDSYTSNTKAVAGEEIGGFGSPSVPPGASDWESSPSPEGTPVDPNGNPTGGSTSEGNPAGGATSSRSGVAGPEGGLAGLPGQITALANECVVEVLRLPFPPLRSTLVALTSAATRGLLPPPLVAGFFGTTS